ncbi:MAG: sensor signal transduction histidine kinase [Verrucomicrobiales bacterium]|nr:sensor signal transduction histidine kinase [Verrucomicrobiales bacterium]
MPRFHDIPIKRKLTLLTMLTSFVALLLACVAFITYERVASRQSMVRDYSILADMFDDNVAPGLAFNDPASLEQTLKTLSADPHIIAGVVYNKAGKVVSKWERIDIRYKFQPPAPEKALSRFESDRLEIFQPITLAGEELGTVLIVSDLDEFGQRLRRYGLIAGLVLVASSLVAFGLSTKLCKIISEPISDLAKVANAVAAEKNYSIRAVKLGQDELGGLIDNFNEMLNQIAMRDSALQEARIHLEKRVAERTTELQNEVVERRRTEEEREKFFAMVENSTDFISMVTLEGNVFYLNPAGRSLMGFEKTTRLESIHWPDSFDEKNWKLRSEVLIPAVLAEGRWEGEIQMRNSRNGTTVDLYAQAFLVTHAESLVPLCIATVQRNITDRKRAEQELEKAHRDLLETSRQAGMAEVATGVLHNVGNVLNSVNVSSACVIDNVKKSKVTNLSRMVALLRKHEGDLGNFVTNDPKGRQLPDYLATLAEHLAGEQAETLTELAHLQKNIDHIRDIVTMQQSFAKVSGVAESLKPCDLVEDALKMNATTLARHDIQVIREFHPVLPVMVEKHKVLQILVNLIRNARHACDDSLRIDKQVTVRIANGEGRVRISVSDNGVGILPENLARIFNHGFTTKKDGHGFGLHSGALAARELGGSLQVQSDGPGKGAMFTLELLSEPTMNGYA